MVAAALLDTKKASQRLLPPWVSLYIGLPYLEKGRTREEGCDCYGLVRLALLEQFQIALPIFSEGEYARPKGAYEHEVSQAVLDLASQDWEELKPSKALVGDVICLRIEGHPIHIGLILAPGWMLHIEEGLNAVCESYLDPIWCDRFIGIWRYNG